MPLHFEKIEKVYETLKRYNMQYMNIALIYSPL